MPREPQEVCHKIGDFLRDFACRAPRDFKTAARATKSSFVIGRSGYAQAAHRADEQHAVDEAGFDDDVRAAARTGDARFRQAGEGTDCRIAVRGDSVHAPRGSKIEGS
jgi:hypothetical protein